MEIITDKELFQWEKNRFIQVIIDLAEDPQISYVQFYNKNHPCGPENPLVNGLAKIPNHLLKEPYPIMAIACTGTPGDTKPIKRKEFKVIKRARPVHYYDDENGEEGTESKWVIYDGGEET